MRYWVVLLSLALLSLSGCDWFWMTKADMRKLEEGQAQIRQEVKDGDAAIWLEVNRGNVAHDAKLNQIELANQTRHNARLTSEQVDAVVDRQFKVYQATEDKKPQPPTLPQIAEAVVAAEQELREKERAAEPPPAADDEEDPEEETDNTSSGALERLRDRMNGKLLTKQRRCEEVINYFGDLVLIEYDAVPDHLGALRTLEFEEVNSRGRTVLREGVIEGQDTRVLMTIRRKLKPYAAISGQAFSTAFLEGVEVYFGALAEAEDRRAAEDRVNTWLRRIIGGDKGFAQSTPAQKPYVPTRRENSYPSSPFSRSNYPNGYRP